MHLDSVPLHPPARLRTALRGDGDPGCHREHVAAQGVELLVGDLDEPEAPLSPLRQLALLALLKEMTAARCQFMMATHSPILLAFPEARILSCDACPIEAVRYEDLENVRLVRDFLNAPERYLERL